MGLLEMIIWSILLFIVLYAINVKYYSYKNKNNEDYLENKRRDIFNTLYNMLNILEKNSKKTLLTIFAIKVAIVLINLLTKDITNAYRFTKEEILELQDIKKRLERILMEV